MAILVWHPSRPSAASVLGLGKGAAYAPAANGDLPAIRIGGRVWVKVPELLRMFGHTSGSTVPDAA